MSELSKLRMELKTEIELIAIRQGDMANVVDGISAGIAGQGQEIAGQGQQIAEQGQRIAEQGQRIAEQGQRIAEHGRQIAEQALKMQAHANETARLGREVAEGSRWMQGRMRLLNQRFEAVLGAVEKEGLEDRDRLTDLEVRVTRLEQDRSSAA